MTKSTMEQSPVQGVVIYTDGCHEQKVFKELTDYQTAIDGYLTGVRLYDYRGNEAACAYVDDEGLLKSKSLNPLASAISFLFGNTPHLVGNMVIVGKSDDEGYDTDIPDYLIALIKNISPVKGEVI